MSAFLKSYLKRILPLPITIFQRELDKVNNLLNDLKTELDLKNQERLVKLNELKKIQDETLDSLNDLKGEIYVYNQHLILIKEVLTHNFDKQFTIANQNYEQIKDISTLVQQIDNNLVNKPIYWSNLFERKVVKSNWGIVMESSDFEEKFLNLIHNLDGHSIQVITRILTRQKQYLTNNDKAMDLFTRAEQEELRLKRENFDFDIIKISENLFVYHQYLLPINHFEESVFYYKHGLGELYTVNTVIGKSIIDVGGYIGDSVLIFSELSPKSIYTFEAVPENFLLLEKTVELNQLNNVVAENVALMDKKGTMTIHVDGPASSPINRQEIAFKKDIIVPTITLDEYVQTKNIEVGLIKVDIEGGEPLFLKGAKQTICTQKPILLISIYHNAHDFFEIKPLLESWNLGYKFTIYKPTIESITGEILLLAEIIT